MTTAPSAPPTAAPPAYTPPTCRLDAYTADAPGPDAHVRARAAARLAPVCAGWPPHQFAALLADVVQFRLRWAAWDRA